MDLARHRPRGRILLVGATTAAVVACTVATRQYLAVWHDGAQLFRNALATQGDNYTMRFCLGGELTMAGKIDEAVAEFSRCVALSPGSADGHFGLGYVLDMKGDTASATSQYRRALEINPRQAKVHTYLGDLLARTGDRTGAAEHFREALRLQPEDALAWEGLCRILKRSREKFEIPLFPACGAGNEEPWASLDKQVPENYVNTAYRWPVGAVADE
jgi:Flp pilus assembly protein TadD